MARKIAGPDHDQQTQRAAADRGHLLQARDHDQDPHRGQNGAALKGAARMIGSGPAHVDADNDPDRRQELRKKSQNAVRVRDRRAGPARRPRTGPAPATRRRPAQAAEPPSPAACRKPGRRTGRPRPDCRARSSCKCAMAAGASVATVLGRNRTTAASPADISAQSTAAATLQRACRSGAAELPVPRTRRAAPINSMPVMPLPIAASVSATSMAASRTQAIASSNP